MALVVDGGGLVNKGGALGTGAACCCNKCSGPCPTGVSECAPGCGCKDSQCVPCSGPCDEENPCGEGCSCIDGECGPADCCFCNGLSFAWQGGEWRGRSSWDSKEEAKSAAEEIVGICESLAEDMKANGYCDASVTEVDLDTAVYPFTPPWLDPPVEQWFLNLSTLIVAGGCCSGEYASGPPLGPKYPFEPLQNNYVFGVTPCVDNGQRTNVTCFPCSGCQGDPCCQPGVANPLP